jgi:hypothetical protein
MQWQKCHCFRRLRSPIREGGGLPQAAASRFAGKSARFTALPDRDDPELSWTPASPRTKILFSGWNAFGLDIVAAVVGIF